MSFLFRIAKSLFISVIITIEGQDNTLVTISGDEIQLDN
jgi:hypothetical protein